MSPNNEDGPIWTVSRIIPCTGGKTSKLRIISEYKLILRIFILLITITRTSIHKPELTARATKKDGVPPEKIEIKK
jgi:hypothetical protein